jgi:hypothetical protein
VFESQLLVLLEDFFANFVYNVHSGPNVHVSIDDCHNCVQNILARNLKHRENQLRAQWLVESLRADKKNVPPLCSKSIYAPRVYAQCEQTCRCLNARLYYFVSINSRIPTNVAHWSRSWCTLANNQSLTAVINTYLPAERNRSSEASVVDVQSSLARCCLLALW